MKRHTLACILALSMLIGCGQSGMPTQSAKAPPIIKTTSGIEMVLIPAGQFEMGSGRGKENETPVHKVTISAFLLERCEVTQEQFSKLQIGDASAFKGPTNPAEMKSWQDAMKFCNARSRAEGLKPCYNEDTGDCDFLANGYRLPTEAEWEYACRAGGTNDYSFGGDVRQLGDYAWYAENASGRTHPVGEKKPNAWGLCDMHGNVAEWCNDVYDKSSYKTAPSDNPRGPAATDDSKYVLRGGSWKSKAANMRSSFRVGEVPGSLDACFAQDEIGFRCARKAPESAGATQSACGPNGHAMRALME